MACNNILPMLHPLCRQRLWLWQCLSATPRTFQYMLRFATVPGITDSICQSQDSSPQVQQPPTHTTLQTLLFTCPALLAAFPCASLQRMTETMPLHISSHLIGTRHQGLVKYDGNVRRISLSTPGVAQKLQLCRFQKASTRSMYGLS